MTETPQNANGVSDDPTAAYYEGSTEVATPTAVAVRRLEMRRKLTLDSHRLVIVLVGLPGRGKSFVGRKLQNYLTWRGTSCKVFNVGKYRRNATAHRRTHPGEAEEDAAGEETEKGTERYKLGSCDANFFDSGNKEAVALRQEVASDAMDDMLNWLDSEEGDVEMSEVGKSSLSPGSDYEDGSVDVFVRKRSRGPWGGKKDRVGIFDATNSTKQRRQWILEQCAQKTSGEPIGVVFVESLCDDQELLEANYRFKIANSPDFKGMSEEEALVDLRDRVSKYEAQYETLDDDSLSYVKLFNLSSKMLVNHIYGRMAKVVVPGLMAWNIGSRPIYICRAGQTMEATAMKRDKNDPTVKNKKSRKTLTRGDTLGVAGQQFRDCLAEFIVKEGKEYMASRASALHEPSFETGTSVSGLAPFSTTGPSKTGESQDFVFPLHVMTSLLPRAVDTATWDKYPFHVEELSSLNPLDKGDFTGLEMDDIRVANSKWYARMQSDPFRTRFPGGECYGDLINRLEPCIIEMEQQISMVLVVSHVSVIQALMSYFRATPVEQCASIEVPMHTVLKFTPKRGGGWAESHHPLLDGDDVGSGLKSDDEDGERVVHPIWDDFNPSAARKKVISPPQSLS